MQFLHSSIVDLSIVRLQHWLIFRPTHEHRPTCRAPTSEVTQMTYLNATHSRNAGLSIEISALVHNAVQTIQDFRDYRATVRALSALDGHALSDLGMHRSEIKAKAYQAVYGV